MTALVVAASIVLVSVSADAFLGSPKTTFVAKPGVPCVPDRWVVMRGGAAAATTAATLEDDIEFESSDEDLNESEKEEEGDEDDEDEEAEVDLDPKLAKATQQKAATIKTKMVKEAVAAVVKAPKKKSSSSLMSMLYVPYIIKACLNPFTFLKMTKAYWSSLINLEYLAANTDSSQNLRSALEAKAKKTGGSPRGKRKFKPGQAKVRITRVASCFYVNHLRPAHRNLVCRRYRTCPSSVLEVKEGMYTKEM